MEGERQDAPRTSTSTANAAWSIVSYLLSGMLVWGGVGWLIDRWRGGGHVFLAIGVLVGVAASLYLVFVRIHSTDGQ
jgi:F0F1-type ATP synthase assembly protein I